MVTNIAPNIIARRRKQIVKTVIVVALAFIAALLFSGGVLSQGFALGYATDDAGLRPGMAVALSGSSTGDKQLVERASPESGDKIIGVATEPDDNLVSVGAAGQTVYVVTSGTTQAFVSDINGPVKKGDAVTISPLRGILMRADDSAQTMGTALEDFPRAQSEPQTVKTASGDKNILVAKFSISLDNSLSRKAAAAAESSLQRLGRSITGKQVGELQVIIALIIFLIVMVAEGSIIYGAVSSAITALGRNPLAKNIIRREMMRVVGLSVVVLLVGLAAIFAVLSV